MSKIFQNIEELKATVKINANMPFDALLPFINDALDIYFRPYLGADFILHIENNLTEPEIQVLLPFLRRSLGPLAVMLYTHEGSINIGDSGHTVQKSEKYSPASDSKITQVIDSLSFRGYQALDRLLSFLYDNTEKYPPWIPASRNNYLNSPTEYQEIGCIDIGYSRLTFEKIRPVISMIEFRYIPELISPILDKRLREHLYTVSPDQEIQDLIVLIRKYIAALSASIVSSERSRDQRSIGATPEYRPLIRPLFRDSDNSENFFNQEADYLHSRIKEYVRDNAEKLDVMVRESGLNFNKKENKIFVAE